LEKALNLEYLMMDPEEYLGRDRKLRKADEESLNQLFLDSYHVGNFALARYYLSIGANLLNVEFDRELYIRKLAQYQSVGDYRDLFFETLTRFPEVFSWEVEFGGGATVTALTHFSYTFSPEDFREIVKLCDDVDLVSIDGRTTLSSLVGRVDSIIDKKEKIEILLEAGADPSVSLPRGKNILHRFNWWPVEEDYSEILEVIRQSNPDFNQQDDSGRTPLHLAVYPFGLSTNSVTYVRFLLENGADKYLANNVGVLPVHLIGWYGKTVEYNPTPIEFAPEDKETMEQLRELLE